MKLLTPRETADRLKVKIDTLALWRAKGYGPRWIKLSARLIRYDEADVIRWIKEGRR